MLRKKHWTLHSLAALQWVFKPKSITPAPSSRITRRKVCSGVVHWHHLPHSKDVEVVDGPLISSYARHNVPVLDIADDRGTPADDSADVTPAPALCFHGVSASWDERLLMLPGRLTYAWPNFVGLHIGGA